MVSAVLVKTNAVLAIPHKDRNAVLHGAKPESSGRPVGEMPEGRQEEGPAGRGDASVDHPKGVSWGSPLVRLNGRGAVRGDVALGSLLFFGADLGYHVLEGSLGRLWGAGDVWEGRGKARAAGRDGPGRREGEDGRAVGLILDAGLQVGAEALPLRVGHVLKRVLVGAFLGRGHVLLTSRRGRNGLERLGHVDGLGEGHVVLGHEAAPLGEGAGDHRRVENRVHLSGAEAAGPRGVSLGRARGVLAEAAGALAVGAEREVGEVLGELFGGGADGVVGSGGRGR